jgi:hypothetical protein
VHDAAAPLLGHELLPPPHELRPVLPHHPSLQTPPRTRTPSPGHYADGEAFRDELIFVSEEVLERRTKKASGLVPREGRELDEHRNFTRTFRLARKRKGLGSGGWGFLGIPGREEDP